MSDTSSSSWCVVIDNPGIGKLRLAAPDASARLSSALGFSAPDAGRVTGTDELACIRIGPYEWLLTGDIGAVHAALARSEAAFGEELALILDISHGGFALRLFGARAVERIAAGCDLDLHDTAFPTGHATRTRFGDVPITLARLGDGPDFRLIGDQSHADYIILLLGHAALA